MTLFYLHKIGCYDNIIIMDISWARIFPDGKGEPNEKGMQFYKNLVISHNLLLSHGLTVKAYREMGFMGEIGITLNMNPVYPASDRAEDLAVAKRYNEYINKWLAVSWNRP